MTLEWLRRNDAKWDQVLRTYLFTEIPITEVEAEAEANDAGGNVASAGSLSIGDLRREPPR
jgi:uncharacterized protein